MNADHNDEGIQVGECPEQLKERIKNSSSIYSLRKDVIGLKSKLQIEVASHFDEYWSNLASFIHGQCSKTKFDELMKELLVTNEAKLLHNELIRAIIFNAHFSMIPPPNVEIPRKKPTIRETKPLLPSAPNKTSSFMHTYTAADLHHIPSINQLSSRIGVILNNPSAKSDSKAISIILTELKKYISHILKQSLALSSNEGLIDGRAIVTVDHVMQVLKMNGNLSAIISPSVLSKFSMTTK